MDLQQLQVDEHDSLEYNDATEEIERELKESETVDVPTDLCLPAVSGAFSNAFVVSGEANGSISGADGTVVAAAHGAGASVSSSTGSSWPAQRARPSSQDVVANGDDSTDTASSADYAVCSESTNSNEQQVIR